MSKKILSMLLALLMVLSLAACGGGDSTPDDDTPGSTPGNTSEPSSSGGDGEIKHLIMAFPTWTGAPADTQMVQDAINEITREKLGIEVELQIYDAGSYRQSLTLALSGGEQIDILSCMLAGYSTLANQGYLLDLNENDLLNTYGQGVIEAMGQEYIDATKYNGYQYGLPNNRDMAQGRGCVAVQTRCLEGIGYQFPNDGKEIIQITEEELCDIMAKIHETFPELETFRPVAGNSMAQYTAIDRLGGDNFGVLEDYGHEAKVVNCFESPEYYAYCELMYDWNQKGYISKDAATDTTAVTELVKSNVLAAYHTGGKPGIKYQETAGDNTDMTIFQTKKDFVASASVAAFPWSISINTVDAVAAMQLLNEFYQNAELSNLLTYGIEGVHYALTENGQMTTQGVEKAADYGTLPFLAPNQYLNVVSEFDDPNLWDNMRAFNNEAEKSVACGFAFDATSVATEMTACSNVYAEYQTSVEYGFVDPAVGIPEMNEKMMNAGLQKIIDAKQEQLTAWLAQQ